MQARDSRLKLVQFKGVRSAGAALTHLSMLDSCAQQPGDYALPVVCAHTPGTFAPGTKYKYCAFCLRLHFACASNVSYSLLY